MNQKQEEKINNLVCETYSWNKGGLKLFRFREYGPLFLNQILCFVVEEIIILFVYVL